MTRFHNFDQISQFQTNFTISNKFHNFNQISQFQPNFTISTKFHNFNQISQFQPNFPISTKSHNFSELLQFQWNFTISVKFHNFSQKLIIQEISLLANAGTLLKSGIPAARSLVALVLIAPVSTCLFLTIENIKTLLSSWPDNKEWNWIAFAILAMFSLYFGRC